MSDEYETPPQLDDLIPLYRQAIAGRDAASEAGDAAQAAEFDTIAKEFADVWCLYSEATDAELHVLANQWDELGLIMSDDPSTEFNAADMLTEYRLAYEAGDKPECERLRELWKQWQGEDDVHETAFGEP